MKKIACFMIDLHLKLNRLCQLAKRYRQNSHFRVNLSTKRMLRSELFSHLFLDVLLEGKILWMEMSINFVYDFSDANADEGLGC